MVIIPNTLHQLATVTAEEIMTSPVETIHMWDSIHDAAKIFADHNISSLAVVDEDQNPLGVITKSDLAQYERERVNMITALSEKMPDGSHDTHAPAPRGFHLEPEESTIESWMTPALFDVQRSATLPEITQKMVKNGIHHLFVCEGRTRKKVVGVITSFDILIVMSRALNPEIAVV